MTVRRIACSRGGRCWGGSISDDACIHVIELECTDGNIHDVRSNALGCLAHNFLLCQRAVRQSFFELVSEELAMRNFCSHG